MILLEIIYGYGLTVLIGGFGVVVFFLGARDILRWTMNRPLRLDEGIIVENYAECFKSMNLK